MPIGMLSFYTVQFRCGIFLSKIADQVHKKLKKIYGILFKNVPQKLINSVKNKNSMLNGMCQACSSLSLTLSPAISQTNGWTIPFKSPTAHALPPSFFQNRPLVQNAVIRRPIKTAGKTFPTTSTLDDIFHQNSAAVVCVFLRKAELRSKHTFLTGQNNTYHKKNKHHIVRNQGKQQKQKNK